MHKKIKFTRETLAIFLILILSAVLNFANLSIEGYGNSYYAACVRSMTMSLKNFFFVSFDPAGFVSIDKPPLGYWLQAISAKIFGFSGVSILLPSALAGVISVLLIYIIVKRSFGTIAGLISALLLAITPVFVAVSRNNTVDNILMTFLLLAMWALSIAAEKGKLKYLIISMVLVGVGFNVKMLQAYMIVPGLYITYLLSTAIPAKKRLLHLVLGTFILVAVSMSWAFIVDSVPASSRPYVDSSTNNTVKELIFGHNGLERISLGNSDNGYGGAPNGGGSGRFPANGQMPKNPPYGNQQDKENKNANSNGQNMSGNVQMKHDGNLPNGGGPMRQGGNLPSGAGGGPGGGSSQLQGTFGGQVQAGFTRLFSKNILSDQIVWFIPIAIFGFICASIKEKLNFHLDNNRKQSLMLCFACFLPEFIYFSFNTGTFHSYYLTMLALPIAALAGIGIASMWEFYKEGGWKSWFLPAALIVNGALHLLMLYYFISYSSIVKVLMAAVVLLNILPSILLGLFNIRAKKQNGLSLKKAIVSLALLGTIITPFVGSSTVLFTKVSETFPGAGLELLSSIDNDTDKAKPDGSNMNMQGENENSKLIEFLEKNKTTEKYLLVVANSNSASDIIIKTGEPVMSLGGFLGSDKIVTLSQFKEMAKKGEIRYVMAGGMGGGGNSSGEIMNWVQKTGKPVSIDGSKNNMNSGRQSEQLYDLKSYTDSFKSK